jgi:hypothetical protein
MKIPKQTGIYNPAASTGANILPSNCNNGTLVVTFGNGTSSTIFGGSNNTVGCCYNWGTTRCDPCESASHYNGLVGQHFPTECGTNNKLNCLIDVQCHGWEL